VLVNWYATAPDTTTHSAAGWALRKWKFKLPEIAPSEAPSADSNWHVNTLDMTMLKIPAGSFVRFDRWDMKAIEQTVTLTRSFLLADSEVTLAQFQQFLDDPEYPDTEKPTDRFWEDHKPFSPTEQHPVQQVSWYDAVLFCNWLSGKEDLMPCYERTGEKEKDYQGKPTELDAWRLIPGANGYRLPTEAEWEYACRAGSTTTCSWGDDESLLARYAVCNSKRAELAGSKLPNGWGLFDVYGNVDEWCHDWHGPYGSAATPRDRVNAGAACCVAAGTSFLRRASLPAVVTTFLSRNGAIPMVSVRRELTPDPLYCFTLFCDSVHDVPAQPTACHQSIS
jgi:formylglycine-generating enzyme required for sulfatase activity